MFQWDRFGLNRIKSAYLCFDQHEACSRSGPCPSDPAQNPGTYHGPPHDMTVNVTAFIELELEFLHWGPLLIDGSQCGCCFFGDATRADRIKVNIIGEFCGPVPWGEFVRASYVGYDSDDNARMAAYPGAFFDPSPAVAVADQRGACGAMFVDQGDYGDFFGGQSSSNPAFNFFDDVGEPAKRCPSRIGGPQFYCPPSMRWRWSYTGGANNWVPLALQPNQWQARNQCWSLQVAKNDGDDCADGRINDGFGAQPVGCTDPNCRRGCSLNETKNSSGVRVSPHDKFRATPWGCGHCVDEYPVDPLATV